MPELLQPLRPIDVDPKARQELKRPLAKNETDRQTLVKLAVNHAVSEFPSLEGKVIRRLVDLLVPVAPVHDVAFQVVSDQVRDANPSGNLPRDAFLRTENLVESLDRTSPFFSVHEMEEGKAVVLRDALQIKKGVLERKREIKTTSANASFAAD